MSTARLTGWLMRSEALAFFDCALAGTAAAPNTVTANSRAAKRVDIFFIIITPERPGMILSKAFKSSYEPGFFASFKMPGRALWLASGACGLTPPPCGEKLGATRECR